MPSLKMQQWETEFLGYTGKLKELVLKSITEDKFGDDTDEKKQEFLIQINKMFECGHVKVRKMNKTVAFLHRQLDEVNQKFTVGDQVVGTDSSKTT